MREILLLSLIPRPKGEQSVPAKEVIKLLESIYLRIRLLDSSPS